ncbi:MAG TPA: site-specific DNA-methyltransferase [Nocardioidaceae bacterium]|nr:site-specific DNA-methyltransferase [Nocardioidaceae bacterium]
MPDDVEEPSGSAPEPYYADDDVTLDLGDMRQILPLLDLAVDCVVADPPYGETSLPWDRWPEGWVRVAAATATSMWCFGSMRLFGVRFAEFLDAGWAFSQDVVWQKHNGSGFHADRFRRVHEHVTHWYQGRWGQVHHAVPTTPDAVAKQVRRKERPAHMGEIERGSYTSKDGGPRLMRSVIEARSMHGRALHPTEKPTGILQPLLEYACPPGGLALDPFAGSGSTALAARLSGRRAVLIEADERYCEAIVRRLAQDVLPLGGAS